MQIDLAKIQTCATTILYPAGKVTDKFKSCIGKIYPALSGSGKTAVGNYLLQTHLIGGFVNWANGKITPVSDNTIQPVSDGGGDIVPGPDNTGTDTGTVDNTGTDLTNSLQVYASDISQISVTLNVPQADIVNYINQRMAADGLTAATVVNTLKTGATAIQEIAKATNETPQSVIDFINQKSEESGDTFDAVLNQLIQTLNNNFQGATGQGSTGNLWIIVLIIVGALAFMRN